MSEPPNEPRVSGPTLPGERTALAWLRTALAFGVGALVLTRLLAHSSLPTAIGCGCAVLAAILLILRPVRYRFRAEEKSAVAPDGVLPARVTALAVVVGGVGLVYVLLT